MFGFKPMITGSPVMISSDELEPMRFDSMSKASTLQDYHMLHFYMVRRIPDTEFALMEKRKSSFKRKATEFGAGVGRCPYGQTFECASMWSNLWECIVDSVPILHWFSIR